MKKALAFIIAMVMPFVILTSCAEKDEGMTEDEVNFFINNEFVIAKELYDAFAGKPFSFSDQKTVEAGGFSYAPVSDSRYSSYEYLIQTLSYYFTDSFIGEFFAPELEGAGSRYKNIDGAVYVNISADASPLPLLIDASEISIEEKDAKLTIVSAPTYESGDYIYIYTIAITNEGDDTVDIFKIDNIGLEKEEISGGGE